MKFRLPGIYKNRHSGGYVQTNSTARTAPRCSSSDGVMQDEGNRPYTLNLRRLAEQNENFRTALWTGKNLQLTVMNIPVGGEIGFERHDKVDQFIGIVSGYGEIIVEPSGIGRGYTSSLSGDYATIVPAGTRHNVRNTGKTPLKIYSIYTPPNHPYGTVDVTKADSDTRHYN